MSAARAIEKVEAYKKKTLETELDRARERYDQAKADFDDTGYDRYYNKMKRLEMDIEKLEDYVARDKAKESLVEKQHELESQKILYKKKLNQIKSDLKVRLLYLRAAIPDCVEARDLEYYIEKLED